MKLSNDLPEQWRELLSAEFDKKYWPKLETFVGEERASQTVFPPKAEVFSAFEACNYDDVKVLLLGQDPYHGEGQAHGLSFSVRPGVKIPPSLRNVYKEMADDVGTFIPNNGYLMPWAEQGVMLLNAVLTVRASTAASHRSKGWEKFTDAVIKKLNERDKPMVFLLWGGFAKKKARFVTNDQHLVIESTHPSPLAVRSGGFFGSKPFSRINEFLKANNQSEIDWQIPDL